MPYGEKVFRNEGWTIRTTTGPIMGDKDMDEYRRVLSAIVLPEMVFHLNRVDLIHEASGTVITFNALDALAGWRHEDLPPLQVRVAEEWRKAREHEIQQQNAVQLTYDWTFTTPYTCTVVYVGPGFVAPPLPSAHAANPTPPQALAAAAPVAAAVPACAAAAAPAAGSGGAGGVGASVDSDSTATLSHSHRRAIPNFVCGRPSADGRPTAMAAPATAVVSSTAAVPADGQPRGDGSPSTSSCGGWQATSDQIDRGLLMERDPILFYDELPLYESDLDDNGVCAVTVKLRVMPRCWLVLLRLWVRVDGSMVRLRETRLFCRHDKPEKRLEVLQEVKHCEGSFKDLRARGAPDEGPAYADADAASQVFQAIAPVGLRLLQTRKLLLPQGPAQ